MRSLVSHHLDSSRTVRTGAWGQPWVALALLLTLALTSSCGENLWGVTGQDDKYAVFTDQYLPRDQLRGISPLVALDAAGSIDVCVDIPAGVADPTTMRADIEDAMSRAVTAWNDLLNEAPPPDQDGFVFPPWNWPTVTVNYTCSGAEYTVFADVNNDRAYADLPARRIVLDRTFLLEGGNLFNVLAHEYGHLCGLADTYTEPEIGLDVYGQPDSMMQYAQGFTDDDRAGIWNVWRYLVNGGEACGPGYSTQARNTWGTYCIAGEGGGAADDATDSSSCLYRCSDYGMAAGQCALDTSGGTWECTTTGCLERVYECGSAGGGGGDDGGGSGSSCTYACGDYGMASGDCAYDESGYAWQCDGAGCLQNVASCDGGSGGGGSSCAYACADYGWTAGMCGMDESGYAWQCDGSGCLQNVESCGGASGGGDWSGCTYACADYGWSPGMCGTDDYGYAWWCDDSGCLQNVESCY